MTSPLAAIADALWDLRDHAFDHAELWAAVTPETAFQVMAEVVERTSDAGDEMDWTQFPRLVMAETLRPGPSGS